MAEPTWRIGDIEITRVVEIEATGGMTRILPDATRERVREIPWMYPHFADEDGRMRGSIHALCIQTPEQKIIVDTCVGNDKMRPYNKAWDQLQTGFLDDLAAAGFAPEAVDTVMCTHLHVDHVGWNTRLVDDKWVPTFPQARYLMAKREVEHWNDEDDATAQQIMADSVQPIFDAGLVETVAMDQRIGEGLSLIPSPGHTPGHVSVLIESQGEQALITGDFLHHPCQFAHPEWSAVVDTDSERAVHTRHMMFERFADTPTLIIGTHFATPSAGRLVRDGKTYRLDV
ncbi:MAG: MBL fold metallo-hydrolase [Alphaproteobacteria bacterium]